MHAVARPYRLPRRPSSSVSVSSSRVPVMPERMAERDRAAVDVGLVAIEAELLLDGQILAGKGLVHLDQIDLGSSVSPARSSALRVAGAGPMPM